MCQVYASSLLNSTPWYLFMFLVFRVLGVHAEDYLNPFTSFAFSLPSDFPSNSRMRKVFGTICSFWRIFDHALFCGPRCLTSWVTPFLGDGTSISILHSFDKFFKVLVSPEIRPRVWATALPLVIIFLTLLHYNKTPTNLDMFWPWVRNNPQACP